MLKRKKTINNGAEEPAVVSPVSVVSHVGSAGRYFRTALLLVLLIMALATAAIIYLQAQQQQASTQLRVEAAAQQLAARVAGLIQARQGVLSGAAIDNRIVQQLLDEDQAGLEQSAQRVKRLLPGSLRVRLLPKGWDRLDSESNPPFSYASLDILRRAERSGEATPAEVHLAGTPDQHVALAAPVSAADGSVIGVLHAAFPFSLLQQAVAGLGAETGRLELQQMVKQSPLTLVGAGPAGAVPGEAVAVEGTIWRVAYALPGLVFGSDPQLMILGIVALSGLLVVGVLLFQGRHFKQAMRADLESMFGLVEGLREGAVGRVNPPRLEEFGHVFGLIRQVWQQASRAQTGSAPARRAAGSASAMQELTLPEETPQEAAAEPASLELPSSIFRAYDIRGVLGETLTEEIVYQIGRAIGSEARDQGEQTVVVARDGRHSGAGLLQALSEGLKASGCDVLDIGMVPTPVLYFATHYLGTKSGVMITGSHNPPEYNGLKIVINGAALSGEKIADLRQRIEQGRLSEGRGSLQEQDLLPDYMQRILDDVQISRPLKVVVDCGNGVAGVVAPALLQALGCEVIPLYCKVDGDFPNHHPDPGKPENLRDLIQMVQERKADLGVAFDGDGDRLGVVDAGGKVIWPDRLLMLLARDVLSRQPGGDVIYDVKSSRHLADEILSYGGRPVMWKTGHSLIKSKMRETGALLAGEMSGHIFIAERWYGFDDGLYSCARLLELLSMEPMSVSEVFNALPESVSTPELNLTFASEGENFALMQKLADNVDFADAKVSDIDGLRVEFEDGWGLVRPSNTTPALVFRFEADSKASLQQIQQRFKRWLLAADPALKLPF